MSDLRYSIRDVQVGPQSLTIFGRLFVVFLVVTCPSRVVSCITKDESMLFIILRQALTGANSLYYVKLSVSYFRYTQPYL